MDIFTPDPVDMPENDEIERGNFAFRVMGWCFVVGVGAFVWFVVLKFLGLV